MIPVELNKRYQKRGKIDHEVFLLTCVLFPIWTVYWCITHFNWGDILFLYAVIAIGGLHVSLFVHRCWSHKSWKPVRWLNIYGLFMHTIGLFTTSLSWVMTHRKHHHLEDTPNDPHSPYYMPRWRIIFYPRLQTKGSYSPEYIKDLGKDKDQLFFHDYYYHINIALWIAMCIIDPSLSLLSFWIAVLGGYSFKQRLINSIGHADPVNKSTCNRPIWAYIYLDGEPWHNNHSTDPGNWKIGYHWWQVDVGKYCIWAFEKLGWGTITQQKFKRSF